jgi:succinyl-CoA synthetase alpha subunit
MSILIDETTRVLVQGITGRDGAFHTERMVAYGTNVVGGVTPGKGGERVAGKPVFDTVSEAVDRTGANASILFVPAHFAADAVREAIDAGIALVVCITEGISTLEELDLYYYSRRKGARLIGPNCPGIISPGKSKMGILPGEIHRPGAIGVVSRSGTLTYEVVHGITGAGLGQSTCIGIGGDPVVGTRFDEILELFERDPQTEAVAIIGEIGGDAEQQAAQFIKAHMKKKVVAYICGRTAPPGKRMGHAGAIISGDKATVESKVAAFAEAGVPVVDRPDLIAETLLRS